MSKYLKGDFNFGDEVELNDNEYIYIGYDDSLEKEFLWDKENKRLVSIHIGYE